MHKLRAMNDTNIVPLYRTDWNDRIALDLALTLEGSGDSVAELLDHYNLERDDLRRFTADSVFNQRVKHFREEIRENGLSFKMKAKVQAEELLGTSWNLIHDIGVSPSVKADLIKSTVKWAGYEPKPDAVDMGMGSGAVRININLNGISGQAIAIDGESHEHRDRQSGLQFEE